jgi:hypothetical protein
MTWKAAVVAASVATSTPALAEDPPPPGLTTETFHPEEKLDLHWQLLTLPEQAIELAFIPVGLAVGVVERHRLDKRVARLLKFWDGRLKISPRLKVSFGDGLGVGAKLKYAQKLDRRTQASIGFVYRLDNDFEIDGELVQPIGSIDDREVRLAAEVERDQNERFYGLAGERRVLTNNQQLVVAGIDLQPRDWYDYAGLFELGVLRQTLAPGVDAAEIPLGDPMDSVAPPPGFNATAVYAMASLDASYDTRDTIGRPSRGVFADARVLGLLDLRAGDLAGTKLKASASWFLPVMPEARVIVLSAGASAALPLYRGAIIPLPAVSELGREQHLRGYDRVRFRDRYAAWAGVEYRFPIYEYLNTDVGLDTFVFLDGATAFGDVALSRDTLYYSTGGGLRIAHETTLISQLTFGWSPEGIEIFIGGEVDL